MIQMHLLCIRSVSERMTMSSTYIYLQLYISPERSRQLVANHFLVARIFLGEYPLQNRRIYINLRQYLHTRCEKIANLVDEFVEHTAATTYAMPSPKRTEVMIPYCPAAYLLRAALISSQKAHES